MSCHILLVEDDRLARANIARYFQNVGHQVEVAADGESAIELISRFPFDVVVSDLQLPGMVTGIDVLMQQKQASPTGTVVLITAFGAEEIKKQADAMGALYFEKPLWLPDFLGKITQLCP
jgi:CheY-like chemotaxis protein